MARDRNYFYEYLTNEDESNMSTVCHCKVKENAEIIAKILDSDVDGKIADVVEVKTGEWIKGREIAREKIADETLHIDYENFTCSSCGLVLKDLLYHIDGSPFYKFCPNCGADMRERRESE